MLDLRACLPLKKKWRKRSKEEAGMTVPACSPFFITFKMHKLVSLSWCVGADGGNKLNDCEGQFLWMRRCYPQPSLIPSPQETLPHRPEAPSDIQRPGWPYLRDAARGEKK